MNTGVFFLSLEKNYIFNPHRMGWIVQWVRFRSYISEGQGGYSQFNRVLSSVLSPSRGLSVVKKAGVFHTAFMHHVQISCLSITVSQRTITIELPGIPNEFDNLPLSVLLLVPTARLHVYLCMRSASLLLYNVVQHPKSHWMVYSTHQVIEISWKFNRRPCLCIEITISNLVMFAQSIVFLTYKFLM